jgi:hypothetical protein
LLLSTYGIPSPQGLNVAGGDGGEDVGVIGVEVEGTDQLVGGPANADATAVATTNIWRRGRQLRLADDRGIDKDGKRHFVRDGEERT